MNRVACTLAILAVVIVGGASPAAAFGVIPRELRAEVRKLPSGFETKLSDFMTSIIYIDQFVSKGDEPRARNSLKEAAERWQNVLKFGGPGALRKYPVLRKFHKMLTTRQANIDKNLAAAAAATSNRACPKPKYRNAGLERAIRGALLNAFDRKTCAGRANESGCKALRERLRRFGLNGPVKRTYTRYNRTTTERVMTTACVRQVRGRERAKCRAFQLSVQRYKKGGRSWTPWKVYGVGSSHEIGCKRL